MQPTVLSARVSNPRRVLNVQSRAALAEKLLSAKEAAALRLSKQRKQLTTPENLETDTNSGEASKKGKLSSLPNLHVPNCVLKYVSLELDGEISNVSLPKIHANIRKSHDKMMQSGTIPRVACHRQRSREEIGDRTYESQSEGKETSESPSKSLLGTLHWKNRSGNVISVGKPVFLTDMEERVSPLKGTFSSSKKREKSVQELPASDAESLIVEASRLCLELHHGSHRVSNFWFEATIALADISKQTLVPVLRYFNGPFQDDIPYGQVISALIEALKEISDMYQRFLFSWIEEQHDLFKAARFVTQNECFEESLNSSCQNVEKLSFVAKEIISFLEEPGIPSHLKAETIRRDRVDLEKLFTLACMAESTQNNTCNELDESGHEHDHMQVLHAAKDRGIHPPPVCILAEDDSAFDEDSNDFEEIFQENVVELVIKSSNTTNVSIVAAAARKYLTMKVQLQNNSRVSMRASSGLSTADKTDSILESRWAYIHTCQALGVAPQSQLFSSEADDEINLRHYFLGIRGSIAISAGCSKFPVLKVLDLHNCMIGVAGCLVLSESIVNCAKLEHINLEFCIPKSELGNCQELGLAISNFTRTSRSLALSELILSNNCIVGIPIISWGSMIDGSNPYLSKLDFCKCGLGSAACKPLSGILQKLINLRSLNLRWNEFNGAAISEVINVLESQQRLFEFDLSWNSCINTTSSAALQNLLIRNTVLSSLNLSFCNIKPKQATIISAGYMGNQTLRKLMIEGNPLGPQGAQAFLRISSSEYNEEPRMMSLAGCNLDFVETGEELFDFSHPSGEKMVFDLSDEYDWACAFLLCALRCECPQEIFLSTSMNGGVWLIPGNLCDQGLFSHEDDPQQSAKEMLVKRTSHVVKERLAIFDKIQKTGLLTITIEHTQLPNIMTDVTFANNIELISIAIQADGAARSKKFVKLAAYSMSESLISSKQAKSMLAKIDDESSRADFIGTMIDKVVDKDDFIVEIDSLPKDIAKKLKVALKTILEFDPKNASGRYTLDLESFADRTVLKKLMEVNSRERRFRQLLRGGNTSRLGDWENIRNFTLNGIEMRFTSTWQPPEKGKIVCDYTCVIRPPKDAVPIDHMCLEKWMEGLSKFISIDFYNKDGLITHPEECESYTSREKEIIFEGVSWLSNKFYVTSDQLERVLHAFLRAGLSIMTEVIVRLFSRVLDLGRFRAVVLKYFPPENYLQVMVRIGWLNAVNPFEVDGYYRLDLAVPEEREVATFMVDLAVQEPGENWQNEEYDSKPFELPKSWITEVPNKKVLSMTYFTGPNCALDHVRKIWSRKFLYDSSTTEAFRNWKSTDRGTGYGTVYVFRSDGIEHSIEIAGQPSAMKSRITTLKNDISKGQIQIDQLHESARALTRSNRVVFNPTNQ